jgi:hypothetical protein
MDENGLKATSDMRHGHTLSAMVNYRNLPIIIAGQDVYDPYINQGKLNSLK